MSKYHVNPATGEAGLCRASSGRCPFGGDDAHHGSEAEARTAYEKEMTKSGSHVAGHSRPAERPTDTRSENFVERTLTGLPEGSKVVVMSPREADAGSVEKRGYEVETHEVESLDEKLPKGDAYVLNNVSSLSHEDAGQLLKKAKKSLPGRGRVAFEALAMQNAPGDSPGESRWRSNTLEDAMKKAGFQNVSVDYKREGGGYDVQGTTPPKKRGKNVTYEAKPFGSGDYTAAKRLGKEMMDVPAGSTLTISDGRTFEKSSVPGYGDNSWKYKRDTYKYDRLARLEPGSTYDGSYIASIAQRHGAVIDSTPKKG